MKVKKFKHNDEDYEVRIENDEETVYCVNFFEKIVNQQGH